MFNPRQPRDTGGQWVRIGRGELEQMIDALVQPRAAHIAQINNKPGTAHQRVVARDIKARVLRPVKVAPTYHVQVQEQGNGRKVVRVQAKGDAAVVRAIIPEKKHHGNVDVTRTRGALPATENIVNKANFGEPGATPGKAEDKTMFVKAKLKAGLPSGVSGANIGLTEVAKKAAAAKRKRNMAPDTAFGGPIAQERLVEAAVAAKAIKKAQGDRLRAILTRRPPEGLDPHLYWENQQRWAVRMRRPKADRDAIDAMIAHLDGEQGGAPKKGEEIARGHNDVPLRVGDWVEDKAGFAAPVQVLGHGDGPGWVRVQERGGMTLNKRARDLKAAPVPLSRRAGAGERIDPDIEALLINAPGALRPQMRALFAKSPRRPRETAYNYIRRVRNENRVALNRDVVLLNAMRKVRKVAAGLDAGKNPQAPRRGPSAEPAKPQSLPEGDTWLHGAIENVRALGKGGGVNETLKGNIAGKLVFIKPQSGAIEKQIHDGIPPGNDAGRERAAYLIGRQMGMDNIAPVVVRDVPGKGRCIVQGGVGNADAIMGLPRTPSAQQDQRRGALFDAIIGNVDRHRGNMRVSADRVYPIDQGLAFAEGDNPRGGWNHNFLANFWGKTLDDTERAQLENLLTDSKLWNDVKEAGLPREAIVRTQRRIKWMLRNQRFLKNQTQLDGNKRGLDGIE